MAVSQLGGVCNMTVMNEERSFGASCAGSAVSENDGESPGKKRKAKIGWERWHLWRACWEADGLQRTITDTSRLAKRTTLS